MFNRHTTASTSDTSTRSGSSSCRGQTWKCNYSKLLDLKEKKKEWRFGRIIMIIVSRWVLLDALVLVWVLCFCHLNLNCTSLLHFLWYVNQHWNYKQLSDKVFIAKSPKNSVFKGLYLPHMSFFSYSQIKNEMLVLLFVTSAVMSLYSA